LWKRSAEPQARGIFAFPSIRHARESCCTGFAPLAAAECSPLGGWDECVDPSDWDDVRRETVNL